MKILILGGTVFLGRHLVNDALNRGHKVTLFNRGKSNAGLWPQVEQIHGDRDGGLDALAGRSFDAVIDPSGYVPRVVGASVRALADWTGHYTFISTISVYGEFGVAGPTEDSPLATLEDESTEEITGETYGGLKVLCERAVADALPDRSFLPRPGLIVGPHDPTDRFTYWPLRLAVGGEVLAPGGPDDSVQIIDVRDLSAWILSGVEDGLTGPSNCTGPAEPLTMGELIETCAAVAGTEAEPTWVDEEFLGEHEVGAFSELPCWVPSPSQGLMRTDISRARSQGLEFRSLAETARDTLDWRKFELVGRPLKAGLKPEREAELLALWRDRHQADPPAT
jgi:2'-hydroxyisoflavone reductase